MNRIKELRIENNMMQSELGELLHVQANSIGRYEREERDLGCENIALLCRIFDCSADYLLGLSDLKRPELSDAEAELLLAYRAADDRARDMVDLALAPFKTTKKSEAV